MNGTQDTTREERDREELLAALPDRPRTVMARALLLSGRGEIHVGPEGRRGAGFFVVDRDRPGLCQAVHRPVAGLVEELLASCAVCHEILVAQENAEHLASLLPGWIARPATAHVHPAPETLGTAGADVRLLVPDDASLLAHVPESLRAEVELAIEQCPTAATFLDGVPVAFCAAIYETESWWDVSVDTLDEHRRQGHASAAAAFLIDHMLQRGKRPVWGALDADQASLRMAAKYGFRAVERMIVLTPPEQER